MTDRTDWGYPCGVAAVLETFLLGPRAVAELVESGAGSADELLSRVRRGPVYAEVHTAGDDPMAAARALEAALVAYVRAFARQCPDPRIIDLFLIEYDFRDLANYLKAKHCGMTRRPVPGSALPEDGIEGWLADEPRMAALAEAVAVAAEGGEAAFPAARVDLMADGAFIGLMPELAAPFGSPLVSEWATARRRFMAIEATVRARLAGLDPGDIRSVLLGRLPADDPVAALAAVEPDNLHKALADVLPRELAERFHPSQGAVALQALAAGLDAELARILEPARYVASGVERVFGYLWDLFRENRNLRAALGGFAGRIEPELVLASLRGANG